MDNAVVREAHYPSGGLFRVVRGDLLRQSVDGIVNAANGHLAHGGGVAGAIARAAGPGFDAESREYVQRHGVVPTGSAALTGAGQLPFRGVIHAVGPRLGDGNEAAKLESAVLTAFVIANEQSWQSIAFPAVSSGIFAVPVDVCAQAYLRAVARFYAEHAAPTLREIRLCLFDDSMTGVMARSMDAAPR